MQTLRHQTTYHEDADGLFIKQSQELPDDFLAWCREARDASTQRASEMHMVASVPTVVAELWLREGFDIYKEPAAAIIKRLKGEGLDTFVVSKKAI